MSAGRADFVIEPGADWTAQIYWVGEQTGNPIRAAGPMVMDIVDPLTAQRLIRLDNSANGGISTGGSGQGVIQLNISRMSTIYFAAGRYLYDLYLYAYGPPKQRVRLLTGTVMVENPVTDLVGRTIGNVGVAQPDIVLNVTSTGGHTQFFYDNTIPTNEYTSVEKGTPMRASLQGAGSFPTSNDVTYLQQGGGSGPVQDVYGDAIDTASVNLWMSQGSVITVEYDDQFGGLTVSKVETAPGSPASPPISP